MINVYMIKDGTSRIPVQIIRSARRSMAIQVKADQTVIARIPHRVSDFVIKEFILNHRDWIIRKYLLAGEEHSHGIPIDAPPYEKLDTVSKKRIKEKLYSRILYYSEIMGVTVGRITIRNQKTRWGSCSAKGNVNFNYRLYYMPDSLLDYVVIHELAHRKHMNHSPEFWKEVSKYCPDYKLCRKQLKEYSL